jgi:lysophospholipase L1-like esterase
LSKKIYKILKKSLYYRAKVDIIGSNLHIGAENVKYYHNNKILSAAVIIICISLIVILSACNSELPNTELPSQAPIVTFTAPPVTPEIATPEPTAPPSPTPEPTPTPTPYLFIDGLGNPVYNYEYGYEIPEAEAVESDYFSDTCFIGDSRTEGFKLYSGLETADILAARSISCANIYNTQAVKIGDHFVTILEALAEKEYGKIYIMLGINEIGMKTASYYDAFDTLIDRIKNVQPNAQIYIEAIIPVADTAAETHGAHFNNERIREHNEALRQIAVEKNVFYMDTYSVFADENGALLDGASNDGIHLNPKYCKVWLTYLLTHTIQSSENNIA